MSAFFVPLLLSNSAFANQECHFEPTTANQKVLVKWVYDGDTLLVTDRKGGNKRKIRLIGIDTPEVAHHQQKAQPYGAIAREQLRALLKKHDNQIVLEFDEEKHDRYKRELAYTYLPDGKSISEWLLQQGYAKTLVFPPNVKYAECFKKAERSAQANELNLWSLKTNQTTSVADLKSKTKGYIRLKGKVTRVKQGKKTLTIEMKSKFKKPIKISIKKKYKKYFKGLNFEKLMSQEIVVTGILKSKKGKRTIKLKHSSQLEVLSAQTAHDEQTDQTDMIVPTLKWSLEK